MSIEVLWEQLIDKGLEHLVLYQGEQIEAQGLHLLEVDPPPGLPTQDLREPNIRP